ncbi:hypothetical protein ACLMAJ_16740 [Nocardia sp. KC 131]|uniref:hypothetical protein n=1 Tax=Nocardia arseniciresistens TaxID=3392119 RepID=UPI00398EB898
MTIPPDATGVSDWHRACVAAMKSAPLQPEQPLTTATGFVVECARELALAQVATAENAGGQGSSGTGVGAAAMVRSVIYQASVAAEVGRCERSAGAAVAQIEAARGSCGSSVAGTEPAVVILPNTVAAQGVCGLRVDPSGISAGDLIFWDYRDSAPTHVGVAVSVTQLVTVDPVSGGFVQRAIPTARDVRAKRVLGGGV